MLVQPDGTARVVESDGREAGAVLRAWEGLGVWTRATLVGLSALSVVVLALVVVAEFSQQALGLCGLWLLLYRLLIRTSHRMMVQAATSLFTGASLGLLAPLLGQPMGFRFPLLVAIGALFAMIPGDVGYRVAAIIASACLGASSGALIWHLGLCTASSWGHPALLTCCVVAFVGVFSCTPLAPVVMERFLLPALASVLLVVSVGPLFGLLAQGELFEVSSCSTTSVPLGTRNTALAWLGLTTLAMIFQWLSMRSAVSESGDSENPNLVMSLLPRGDKGEESGAKGAGAGLDEKGGPIQDKTAGLCRMPMIMKGIYAEDDDPLLYLTEHEKKLVEICRKDEFERDRILWGGGLL